MLALACVLYPMDLTVLHLAVPRRSADLQPSSAQLLWIVDIYGFMVAGSLIMMGTLGDRIGRRRLLLIGASAFGVASVWLPFSTSRPEMLIATRASLGLAGATLAPSTLSLIRNMFSTCTSARSPSVCGSRVSRSAGQSAHCSAERCSSSSGWPSFLLAVARYGGPAGAGPGAAAGVSGPDRGAARSRQRGDVPGRSPGRESSGSSRSLKTAWDVAVTLASQAESASA